MDIVYSLTCHEDPASFMDLIKNIQYFNRNLKICIIVHANDYMFSELNGKVEHLNPIYYNRRLYTIDIFKSHIENFDYTVSKGIDMTYFIPLASNCYFHKAVTLDYIKSLLDNSPNAIIPKREGWNHWSSILENKKINLNLGELYVSQHEGIILPKQIAEKISEHVRIHDIYNNLECETVFEEYLLASMYSNLTGKQPQIICKIFWTLPNFTPSLEEIINCEFPCVKRVSRDYNDTIRVHFRELTNNYTAEL